MRFSEKPAGMVLSGGRPGMVEAWVDARAAFHISHEAPMNARRFRPRRGHAAGRTLGRRGYPRASMTAIPAATYRDALPYFANPFETDDAG